MRQSGRRSCARHGALHGVDFAADSRLEYSPTDRFEDRASQIFWYRDQPVPPFEVERTADRVMITTEHLRLTYHLTAQGFTRDTLSIEVKATQHRPGSMAIAASGKICAARRARSTA